ncbi:MAG: PhoU domain-containing protein [Petrotogales bacterium]
MEVRRIQLTGGSSYIVTLPKEWIRSLNIQKNDPIGLYMQSNGTILVTPKINREQTQRIKNFNVDSSTNKNVLLRNLIGAYIAGYNSIQIDSKTRMPTQVRETIRDFTQTTIGQEVVEETDRSIIIKDLLNPAEMPFKKTIKRMYIIVKNMHEDVINAIREKDRNLAEEVLLRDNEVDRLHWLIARQHNIILKNVNFAEKMKTTVEYASTSFLISRTIERIGDHIVRIAHNVLKLIDGKIDKKIVDNIHSTSDVSLDIFNKSIASFFRRDINTANDVIESTKKLEQQCNEINTLTLQQKGATAVSFGYIVESIRRIGEYAEDISEYVINYLIDEDKKI